jgi:streptomycin 6-kinase
LDLDTERISDWCFVQSALSWIWALEDGSDVRMLANLTKIFDIVN